METSGGYKVTSAMQPASLMSECPAKGGLENNFESYWPWLLIDWFNRFLKKARYNILNTPYFETPAPVVVCRLRACGQVTLGPGADKVGARVQCPSAAVSPPQWQHRPVVPTSPQQKHVAHQSLAHRESSQVRLVVSRYWRCQQNFAVIFTVSWEGAY